MSKSDKIETAARALIEAIDPDPGREGLRDTPKRVAKWWLDFANFDAGETDTTFESIVTDQMVIVSGIKVWSICEHHLLPFSCEIAVGYIARAQIIGLSKIARIAHRHAHKLQVQERLAHDIADDVQEVTKADVAVLARGEHLCMSMRGIKTPATMTTSVMRGAFMTEAARREFLALALAK